MKIEANPAAPQVMHIDLNSAFAMAEQQANPLLRHKPVGVTNRLNEWSICITASHEAKSQGVGIGTRWREARLQAPGFVMIESDPAKYMYIHKQIRQIFASYSPVSYMKSVDEGIIDFSGMQPVLKGRPLEDIALEIKQRIKDEVGDYMTVNIGIAQNRWLAKVAASFLKPDGLYTIDQHNLELVYAMISLEDLPYIKHRNKQRLATVGIYTPLDFYRAPEPVLVKQVFKSINGHLWYLKLRGYETEVQSSVRTVGRSYVLEHRTSDPQELATLLHKASIKLSRRLAQTNMMARGLLLSLRYAAAPHPFHLEPSVPPGGWYGRRIHPTAVTRSDQIYQRTLKLFADSPPSQPVSGLALTCYALQPIIAPQPSLFEDDQSKRERLEQSINLINDRYGELAIQPAAVAKSKNPMKDKIPFGSIRYFT